MTSIKDNAFSGCDNLTDLYYGGTLKQWSAITVGTGNDLFKTAKTLHCPASGSDAPLTFTAMHINSTVTFNYNLDPVVRYSTDGGNTWTKYTKGFAVPLGDVGNTVSFIGTGVKTSSGEHFSMHGRLAASGDVTSLTNGSGGDVKMSYHEYNCCSYMFDGCTDLITAPALPSTVLAQSCYDCMFRGCTGLTTAPALPATTLAENCYRNMLYGCTGIRLCASDTGSGKTWSIPAGASAATDWNTDMFTGTGGNMDSDPVIGKAYYYAAFLAGDVTGDGYRTTADLIRLAKHLAGETVTVYHPDINGDGTADLIDLVCLMKLLSA